MRLRWEKRIPQVPAIATQLRHAFGRPISPEVGNKGLGVYYTAHMGAVPLLGHGDRPKLLWQQLRGWMVEEGRCWLDKVNSDPEFFCRQRRRLLFTAVSLGRCRTWIFIWQRADGRETVTGQLSRAAPSIQRGLAFPRLHLRHQAAGTARVACKLLYQDKRALRM